MTKQVREAKWKKSEEQSKKNKRIGNRTRRRKQAETIRVEEAPARYYRSSIDRSLYSEPTLRNHYVAVFRPLKTHPVVEESSGASSWTASAGGTSAFSI